MVPVVIIGHLLGHIVKDMDKIHVFFLFFNYNWH